MLNYEQREEAEEMKGESIFPDFCTLVDDHPIAFKLSKPAIAPEQSRFDMLDNTPRWTTCLLSMINRICLDTAYLEDGPRRHLLALPSDIRSGSRRLLLARALAVGLSGDACTFVRPLRTVLL